MSKSSTRLLLSLAILFLLIAEAAQAVPVTSNTGPGGVGTIGVPNSGPVVWLNANNITGVAGGAKVNTWANDGTSGATNDGLAHFGSANTYQASVANGQPAVRLPGASGQREFALGTVSSINTWIFAGQVDGTFNCCDGLLGNIGTDSGMRTFNNGSANWQSTGCNVGANGFNVNGTGGIAYTALQWQTVAALNTSGLNVANLGFGQYFNTGDREINGYLGEMAAYDQTLNAAERAVITSYHAAKYNITSPAVVGDLYSGDTPGNGDFDFNVFGVANVGGATILNAGSAGFGIEVSSLGVGESILAGNKGGDIWYLDVTGSPSSADFGVETLPGFGQTDLLFSLTEGGTFTSLGLTPTKVGDTLVYSLSGAQLQDGYFQLLAVVPEPSSVVLLGLGLLGLSQRRRRK